MRPHPSSIMSGTTAWQQSNVPVRLTAMMRFHFSAVILRNGSKPSSPALFTRMVGRPKLLPDLGRLPASICGRSVTSTVSPDGGAAGGHDLGRRRLGGRAVPVEDGHGVAVGGQALADGQTDTRPAAGDDGHSLVGHWIDFVAVQRRAVHVAGRACVVRTGPVQHAPVVPDHHVADRPLVPVDAFGCGRPGQEIVQQRPGPRRRPCPPRGRWWPRGPASGAPTGGSRPAGAPSRDGDRHRASSSGDGSLFTRRCDASMVWTTRSERQRSFSSSVRSS